VNLQVRQEVSAVLSQAFGSTNSPSFTTREAETTVVVQDGDTVLIGGIIDDSITHNRTGVPFIMDVPVVGRIFRSDSDSVTRTELLVTITPYVIRSRQESRQVTDDFSSRIEGLSRLRRTMQAGHRRRVREQEERESGAPPSGDAPPPAGGDAAPPPSP
jgi:general secretion pathway protein D